MRDLCVIPDEEFEVLQGFEVVALEEGELGLC